MSRAGPVLTDFTLKHQNLNVFFFGDLEEHLAIYIKGNDIKFAYSANNLGVTFNDRLRSSYLISVAVGRVYAMLHNLWTRIRH